MKLQIVLFATVFLMIAVNNQVYADNNQTSHIINSQPTVSKMKGHSQSYSGGFSQGIQDGKMGIYDPAAACGGKTGKDMQHCGLGYQSAYVQNCTKSQFGCGDGPTQCPPGEKCAPSGGNGTKSPPPPTTPGKGNGTGTTPCPKGDVNINGRCVSSGRCHLIDNGTKFKCPEGGGHTTIIERSTVQQLGATNDVNLFIVTTCTADQNNGVLNGNLAALCDASITMMHNEGLSAQLPQVDLYLKARGLL